MAHPKAVQVNLSDIEKTDKRDLSISKLDALVNSYDSFEDQLNSTRNPIALDMSSKPYRIIDGRHRVYAARTQGLSSVIAISV
jgi:ParB-like nuclease domain